MFCRKCGKEIPTDSVFCPECGEKVLSVDRKNHSDTGARSESASATQAAATGTRIFGSFEVMMALYEREILTEALKNARGNVSKAARLLHTTHRIVSYRCRKLGVDWKRYLRNTERNAEAAKMEARAKAIRAKHAGENPVK